MEREVRWRGKLGGTSGTSGTGTSGNCSVTAPT